MAKTAVRSAKKTDVRTRKKIVGGGRFRKKKTGKATRTSLAGGRTRG